MHKKGLAILISSAFLLLGSGIMASEPSAEKQIGHDITPYWSYKNVEGWAKLSADFTACGAGKNQSPINIEGAVDANLPAIKFNYNMLTANEIINNGHTVQVNMWSGGEITLDGEKFKLKQFNFHTPSEHMINGKKFPLEAHFVHLNSSGQIVVVAVMFEPGKDDALVEALWKNIPLKAGGSHKLDAKALNSLEFEADVKNYYRYNGSLTTPPCTEGVRWIVMKSPRHVSQAQVLRLQEALSVANNRPVQKLNARVVVE